MTLLIGTISKSNIVLTADGLSRANQITGAGVESDNFQKLFPSSELPIAIAHHGFNILSGQKVGEFLLPFVEDIDNKLTTTQVKEIADKLRNYAESAAMQILADKTNQGVIGFWVAGFEMGGVAPKLFEICWPDNANPVRHIGIILGGDAKRFIEIFLNKRLGQFRPSKLKGYSEAQTRKYHDTLYSQAMTEQNKVGAKIFGGKKHQLVITKFGSNWTIKPS